MKTTKEYFLKRLKEKLGGEVDYCGVLDGCYVFSLYHKEDLKKKLGPPIYAICNPDDPKKVKVSQSLDIAERLCKQKEKQ